MPDDHSEVVPLLPIPNRTVKRFRANDSAGSRVKVGHRQALTALNAPPFGGAFLFVLLVVVARVVTASIGRHAVFRTAPHRIVLADPGCNYIRTSVRQPELVPAE